MKEEPFCSFIFFIHLLFFLISDFSISIFFYNSFPSFFIHIFNLHPLFDSHSLFIFILFFPFHSFNNFFFFSYQIFFLFFLPENLFHTAPSTNRFHSTIPLSFSFFLLSFLTSSYFFRQDPWMTTPISEWWVYFPLWYRLWGCGCFCHFFLVLFQ